MLGTAAMVVSAFVAGVVFSERVKNYLKSKISRYFG